MRGILRRFRGAVGNAVVWGVSWFSTALALLGGVNLIWGFQAVDDPWRLVLYVSANVGVTGFLTGLAFSGYLRLRYFDRPLLGIRIRRVALGGAAVAVACSTMVGVLARLSVGMPIALGDLLSGFPMVAILGAVTAGTTVRLAQASQQKEVGAAASELEVEQREAMAMLEGEA